MFVIVGSEEIGLCVASLRLSAGHKIGVVEMCQEVLERLAGEIPDDCIVVGNDTDPKLLKSIDVKQVQVVVA